MVKGTVKREIGKATIEGVPHITDMLARNIVKEGYEVIITPVHTDGYIEKEVLTIYSVEKYE